MPDVLAFNEGKNYIFDFDVVGQTWYFLLSNKPITYGRTEGAHTLPTGTITLEQIGGDATPTSAFPASGVVVVNGQSVTYTGKTDTTLTGCSGGSGSVPDGSLIQIANCLSPMDELSSTGEIAAWAGSTPYSRKPIVIPTPVAGVLDLAPVVWNTGSSTDGPANVRSVILVTGSGSTGFAIYAWNLQPDGAGRDMSGTDAQLDVNVTLFLQNVGGS